MEDIDVKFLMDVLYYSDNENEYYQGIEKYALSGYDIFKNIEGVLSPFSVMIDALDFKTIYNILLIFKKHGALHINKNDLNTMVVFYELSRIRIDFYYIKVLKLVLENGLSEEIKEEMINRLNYEFKDMDIIDIDFNEYCKYFYYTYMLIYAYLKDITKAIRIIKKVKEVDIDLFKNLSNYLIKLKINEYKREVINAEVLDKNSKEVIMVLI